MTGHTILLFKTGKSPATRTFSDHASVAKASDACIAGFEEALKRRNPTKPEVAYSAADLHSWLDSLPQAAALVFDARAQAYFPYDKAWLKQQTMLRLQELARNAAARGRAER